VVNFSIAIYPRTTDVENAIDAELADLILTKGGAGVTIYLSDMHTALANVVSLERYTLISPAISNAAESNKIHALGTTTYSDY
jgi:uncharacterized phage protein gp47/JayE